VRRGWAGAGQPIFGQLLGSGGSSWGCPLPPCKCGNCQAGVRAQGALGTDCFVVLLMVVVVVVLPCCSCLYCCVSDVKRFNELLGLYIDSSEAEENNDDDENDDKADDLDVGESSGDQYDDNDDDVINRQHAPPPACDDEDGWQQVKAR